MLATGFTPRAVPRIAAAGDGAHAIVVEGGRATVVRIADGHAACELAVPAGEVDVAWVGSRVVLVVTTESHTDVSLIDPLAPPEHRKLAEIRVETSMRLRGATGLHALLLGARTAAVLTTTETQIAPYQFLARTLPTVVGVAGNLFVVALPGTIEEWDPVSRMPKRRLRLPRAATITSLGGSDRVLWMTTLQEPARLDVLPIVNRGQPKAHELPESIKSVHGHPHSDVVVCIGAETGRLYAIDLDVRGQPRTLATGLERVDVAALARSTTTTAIAARAGQPIAFVSLGSHEPDVAKSNELAPEMYDPTGGTSSGETTTATAGDVGRREQPPHGASPGETKAAAGDVGRRGQSPHGASPGESARTVAESLRGRVAESLRQSIADRASSRPPIAPAAAAAHAVAMHEPGARESAAAVAARKLAGFDAGARVATAASPASQWDRESRVDGSSDREARGVVDGSSDREAHDVVDSPRDRDSRGVVDSRDRESRGVHDDDPSLAPEALGVHESLVLPEPRAPTAWSEGASELMAKLASLKAAGLEPGAPDAPQRATWRDDCGAWARAVASGTFDRAAPSCPPIDVLAARFELPVQLIPALVLLYGSHLAGLEGAAPMDVARVLGRRWDDALGRGKLAALGITVHERSRVMLSSAILRELDELPPLAE